MDNRIDFFGMFSIRCPSSQAITLKEAYERLDNIEYSVFKMNKEGFLVTSDCSEVKNR